MFETGMTYRFSPDMKVMSIALGLGGPIVTDTLEELGVQFGDCFGTFAGHPNDHVIFIAVDKRGREIRIMVDEREADRNVTADHERFMKKILGIEGLPEYPLSIVGGTFVFGWDKYFICGTITSIEHSPEEGLLFYVSTPHFRGMDIRCFARAKDETWAAYGHAPGTIRKGTFKLVVNEGE